MEFILLRHKKVKDLVAAAKGTLLDCSSWHLSTMIEMLEKEAATGKMSLDSDIYHEILVEKARLKDIQNKRSV